MTDSFMFPTQVASEKQEFSWSWFLFSATGRISRSDYWLRYFLPSIGVYFVFLLIVPKIGQGHVVGVITIIFIIFALYIAIAVSIKRWHDIDKSGWWILIIFVPVIGGLWALIENGFLVGNNGPNRFGPSRFPSKQDLNLIF
ncbi:DUF805 domain-containing protein [Kiloniella sp.]|uniref:DUF805 domain-containing protein n=1 Tax=Kiloniella sp. TaxID=1938587 RepID=UPI003B025A24